MEKKLTNRAKQALETQKRIYRMGIDLIKEHGYENITVEDIATKANVSIGTFYHYFKSKFDLLGEIFDHGDRYFEEKAPVIINSDKTFTEKVIDYFKLYAELCILQGVEKVSNMYVTSNEMFLTRGRLMQKLLMTIIDDGQNQGKISIEKSSLEITEQLFLVARGVIFDWCLHKGKSDIKSDISDIIGRIFSTYLV